MAFKYGITLEQAKQLKYGDILYHNELINNDKTPARWRVNGQVKTLKRDPNYVRVPLKHGLYSYGYLVNGERAYVNGKFNFPLEEFELTEERAIEVLKEKGIIE